MNLCFTFVTEEEEGHNMGLYRESDGSQGPSDRRGTEVPRARIYNGYKFPLSRPSILKL